MVAVVKDMEEIVIVAPADSVAEGTEDPEVVVPSVSQTVDPAGEGSAGSCGSVGLGGNAAAAVHVVCAGRNH